MNAKDKMVALKKRHNASAKVSVRLDTWTLLMAIQSSGVVILTSTNMSQTRLSLSSVQS